MVDKISRAIVVFLYTELQVPSPVRRGLGRGLFRLLPRKIALR
jgi:hypothetical protein